MRMPSMPLMPGRPMSLRTTSGRLPSILERFLHRTEGARTAKAWRAVDDRGEAVADFPAVFHNRHTNRLLALRAHRCPRSLGRHVAMSNAGPSYRSTWRPALAGPREEVRLKADATHVARRSA